MCNDLPPPQPSECEEKGEILLSLNKDYVFAIATESVTIHFANVINKGENYGNVFTLQSNLVSHPTTTPPMPKGSSYGYEMSSGNLLITVAGGEISWIPPDYVKPKEATVQLLLTYKPYHCGSEPPQQDCRSAYYRCVEEGGSEEECRRVLQKCLPSVDRKPLCSAYHDMCKGLGPDNCIASCVKKGGDAVECKELYYLCQGDTDFVDRPGEKYCDQGCYANSGTNKCVPYGTRLQIKGDASYCGVDGSTHLQKRDGESAENNYECVSNSARYGVCENVAEQTSVMQKIFGWLSRLFGGGTEPQPVSKEISNFEECVAAGYPMLKSYPAQCKTSDGKTFVQDVS
jgi:hypothetical protein